MKEFRDYIIDNCTCIATKYDDYFLLYINYKFIYEIVSLFDLDEINLLENELF